MLPVGTALAVKIPVYFFSMSIKELGFLGMENALMYLLENLLFLSPIIPFIFFLYIV